MKPVAVVRSAWDAYSTGDVEGALPVAVRVHRVQDQAAQHSVIERVVRRARSDVRRAETVAVAGNVRAHPLVALDVTPFGIRRDLHRPAVEQAADRRAVGLVEAVQQLDDIAFRKRGQLVGTGCHGSEFGPRRDHALDHVVVVAVHRVPRHFQARRLERPRGRFQRAGCLREAVARPRVVVGAAIGRAGRVPIADVVGRRVARVDTLPAPALTRIRIRLLAVQNAQVRAQFVGLAGIRGVPCGHCEVGAQLVHRAHHRFDDVRGEHLLRPVGADQGEIGPVRRVRVGVPLQVLDAAGRLRVHHVQIR